MRVLRALEQSGGTRAEVGEGYRDVQGRSAPGDGLRLPRVQLGAVHGGDPHDEWPRDSSRRF